MNLLAAVPPVSGDVCRRTTEGIRTMASQRRYRFFHVIGMLALLVPATISLAGGPSLPTLPMKIPSTRPMSVRNPQTLPGRAVQAPALGQPYRYAADSSPEVRPTEEAPVATEAQGEACQGAPCTPYLRNRAHCPGKQADRIHLYNRQNEPNWYRYYRCCQYGYHPTQWQAWPEGWLTCRHPQPGEHPYDYHPPRPDQKQIDRERKLMRDNNGFDRDEPETLDEPAPKREDSVPPKLVPPTNSTSPPPPAEPLPAPSTTDPGVPAPPAVDPLPMPMPY